MEFGGRPLGLVASSSWSAWHIPHGMRGKFLMECARVCDQLFMEQGARRLGWKTGGGAVFQQTTLFFTLAPRLPFVHSLAGPNCE